MTTPDRSEECLARRRRRLGAARVWLAPCLLVASLSAFAWARDQGRTAPSTPPAGLEPGPPATGEQGGEAGKKASQARAEEEETQPGEDEPASPQRGGQAAVEDLLKVALSRPGHLSAEELAAMCGQRASQLQKRGQRAAARVLREVERLCRRDPDAPVLGLLEQAHVAPGQRPLVARAAELDREAAALARRGHQAGARKLLEEALQIREELYPETRYPDGNPFLAMSLSAAGRQLQAQGEYPRAATLLKRGLAMLERRYPDRHPLLSAALHDLGRLLREGGEYAEARPHLERALTMCEALYPPRDFPRGHPALALSLESLGDLLRAQGNWPAALSHCQRGLAMYETLYPPDRYPKGHPRLAASLRNLGLLLLARGESQRGLPHLRRALEMCEALYPPDQYAKGHADLVLSLRTLGSSLAAQGEYHQARPYLQRAVAVCEALYSPTDYPRGHPFLVECLESLAAVVRAQEGNDRALPYHERALAACEALYAREQYPNGHPRLALSLASVGRSLAAGRDYRRALPYLRRALAASELLYPRDRYPKGHAQVAEGLIALGHGLLLAGEDEQALPYLRRALAQSESLYPEAEYPRGHPGLSASLRGLGALLHARGEHGEALPHLRRAVRMDQDLADGFAACASEAEALNFAAALPLARDLLLSTPDRPDLSADEVYTPVWRGKAAVARVLRRRQEALADGAGPAARQLWQELLQTRRDLASLLLGPADRSEDRLRQVRQLTARKEDLERRLAQSLPGFSRSQLLGLPPHGELVKKLPPGTAFIDLLRYVRIEQVPPATPRRGWRATPSYAAFVLTRGGPVRRVDLGRAWPIEAALAEWRRDIADQKPGPAADRLSELLWVPLARYLPAGTRTVLVAPDGDLTRLPWSALPVRPGGHPLLEDHALAVVPHGPFLLDRLAAPPPGDGPGLLLAVGGVRYGVAPAGAERDRVPPLWGPLPHTTEEVDAILRLAGGRPALALREDEPSPGRLLAELPRARQAHLATHGFFAGPALRSVLQVDERLYERVPFGAERAAPGARNPLTLSGLVLSGAGPRPADKEPSGAEGILTAEAVASLPLQDLELVVLSACETGLGEVAGGEGVFGLQRAFHLAGAHTVVASLWKVDDAATHALMAEFYRNLWQRRLGKLEALRQAQLATLRSSGPTSGSVRTAGSPRPIATGQDGQRWPEKRMPPLFWATWVLSGDPGDLSPGETPSPSRADAASLAEGGPGPGSASALRRLAVGAVLVGSLFVLVRLVRRRGRPGKSPAREGPRPAGGGESLGGGHGKPAG
jgi:CHAT domain-containing protein/tetratricopeptide (TPR) repeat protein